MSLLRYFTSCMSRSKGAVNSNNFKSNYDNEMLDKFYVDEIPNSIKDLLVYIAREGVAVTDLFRRPGNTQDIKQVMRQLKKGETIDWSKYNFYTLANIAKRYLIQIDRGVLGENVENQLIETLDLPDDQTRIESMSCILKSLSQDVLKLLALLFGTWFRMIYHSEVNAMSVEAVAKSVAGSVFPSSTFNPNQVNKASKVMEYLITGFASSELFGVEFIEYFTNETKTSISRIEKFKYEFVYPKSVPKKKSTRLFVRMLLEESYKHGFDLLRDEVSLEQFNAIDNCAVVSGNFNEKESQNTLVDFNNDNDNKTRKRRLSKTFTYPTQVTNNNTNHSDQVQQTSEKRTCVVASPTEVKLTTTKSTLQFDMTQECLQHSKMGGLKCNDKSNSEPSTTESSFPPMENCKSPRLEVSENVKMEDIIKSEMKKMETRMKAEDNSKTHSTFAPSGRFSRVKRQQLERLQKRSDWFLSPPSGRKTEALIQLSPTSPVFKDLPLSPGSGRCTSTSDNFKPIENCINNVDQQGTNSSIESQIEPDFKSDIAPSSPIFQLDSLICNDNAQSDVNRNESISLEEEIEARYFVVHKYYGSMSTKPCQAEE